MGLFFKSGTGGGGVSTTLTSAHIYVGNASNVATDTAVSGVISLSNSGVVSFANDPVFPGSLFGSSSSGLSLYGSSNTYNLGNSTANSLVLGYQGAGKGYRIISGRIASGGSITRGEGFTLSYSAPVTYTVNLSIAGSTTVIAAVACQDSNSGTIKGVNALLNSSSQVIFVTEGGALDFSFIIIVSVN